MDEPGLILQDLRVTLSGKPMLRLSAHVAPGQVVSVMGPSGAGKSTLLGAVMGTLSPPFAVSGRILLDGRDLAALPVEARQIGILFQDPLLFPHLSVGSNLAFGLPRALRGAARRAAVEKALADVGLNGFASRDPATLSGGQKLRVALMRTLLAAPCALLLDEPFSSLDADRRAQIRSLVFERARAAGLPVLMVTHDPADAQAAGGLVIKLD
ncbi:ATP-binding cassette domain-containing protein [Lutimaribacter sp. EGI FJ00015]|uniref:ATP-binding cassette domain-containing protein n=1 Tax=Lutimaribacter degradans TaxID=2945989 RepID=A0ACC5ZY12_9RHOB|nr:ATP-binding cassette domain-containing protein [Lutimaribacter sp. EGI FJ00013]MCM2562995.1 ATP-binding cassette domain-containing protein [Lutimaribacter sp. EGI FJ00013]MCO0614163.1 ATP-binding cassette domain-containing protein [Lutimaribacter sp. EGI FJ00015]MCO0636140.1 ATP-binding cassette domain-containing protein [Lutimaribacter sp. EGI FJ00014]